jgi:hypothetical protein
MPQKLVAVQHHSSLFWSTNNGMLELITVIDVIGLPVVSYRAGLLVHLTSLFLTFSFGGTQSS